MKPTKLFLFLAVAVLLGGCNQKETVVAEIDGWGNDSILVVYVQYADNGRASELADTIFAVNGKFSYTFAENTYNNLHRGLFYRLCEMPVRDAKRIDVDLIGGEKVKIKGKAYDEYVEYTVKGNTLLSDYNNLHNEMVEHLIARDKNEDELKAHLGTPEVDKYFARRRELNKPIRDIRHQYLLNNPDSESSVLCLSALPLDSFYLHTHLTERVRNGALKVFFDDKMKRYEEYQAYLEVQKKELVGKAAPDFTLTDTKGNKFTLSEYKTDKYIVLDFWGTWCGPCKHEIPELKAYYAKHKDKVEIIGIACNEKSTEEWRTFVEQNGLAWINLQNDESEGNKQTSVHYAVAAYPTKYILSPDKVVLAKFQGTDKELYAKLDELVKTKM